jgi:hypothetical protein
MKKFGKIAKHVTRYYYIWKDGGSNGGCENKKVSGCQFFPFRHPLLKMMQNHSIYRKKLMNFFFPTGEKIAQHLAKPLHR